MSRSKPVQPEPEPEVYSYTFGISPEPIPLSHTWLNWVTEKTLSGYGQFNHERAAYYANSYNASITGTYPTHPDGTRNYDGWVEIPDYPRMTVYAVPEKTRAWIEREAARMVNEYIAAPDLPGHRERMNSDKPFPYRYHFLHIAQQTADGDPAMVAYTPNDAYGRRDRKVRVKPGRYLQQFYPELSNEDRVQWAALIDSRYAGIKLRFESDGEKIAQLYADTRHGGKSDLSSCMSCNAEEYGGIHPCSAYGTPGDLVLAYLGTEDSATARAIVYPEKKYYWSSYGNDAHVLIGLLKDQGYTRHQNWTGAKINAIRNPKRKNRLVVPYIDVCDEVELSDCGKFLFLNQGDINCRRTDGGGGQECTCDHCGEDYDADDSDSSTHCQYCYDNAWTCERCDDLQWGDSHGDDASYCRECWHDMTERCTACRSRYISEEHDGHDGFCNDCSEDRSACETCGDVDTFDNMVEVDGEWYCDDDACKPAPKDDDDDDDTTDSTTNAADTASTTTAELTALGTEREGT